jgi:hypothetical protein
MVTASNQVFSKYIAEPLQIFDEVPSPDGENNPKGTNKVTFLVEHFGGGRFSCMGDAAADFPVWQVSSKIVTVNTAQSVRQKTGQLDKPIKHLVTKKSVRPYIRALRPHQWLKKIFAFVPMLAAHQFDTTT